jgi:hypothetical protein
MKFGATFLLIFWFLVSFTAYGQVTDDFSDGDFTTNPTWSGTESEFIINSNQQLQLNSSILISSSLSVQHNLTSIDNKEWRIWVKQSFAGSSANYGRIYLTSDNQSVALCQNGYYLQMGEANSTDAIRLFRLFNGTSTEICSGPIGQITSGINASLRVKRNSFGDWFLYADFSGGANYILLGSGNDATNLIGVTFGINCVYTSSNANKFFYDDIYIGNEIIDNQPPVLTSATAVSSTQVDVLFNESLDPTSAQNVLNYSLNPPVSIASAVIDPLNTALVHVSTSTAFTNGTTYTLTTTNISDISSNVSGNQSTTFQYLVADSVVDGDVIINEFFPDPTPVIGLPEVEFVEIYNKSNKIFNLTGWKIGDASSDGTIANAWLFPGEYKVLTATANIPLFTSTSAVGVTSFPSLNNAGDDVVLKDNYGQIIDKLSYTDTWYKDEIKKSGGYSLELINPNDPCSDDDNWIASTWILGGTPGSVNSVYSVIPDTIAPSISMALALAPNFLELQFDEGMDSTSLANALLSFNPNLTIQNKFIQGSHPKVMTLQFNENLVGSQLYSFTLGPISDCWMNSTERNGTFILTETAQKGDVIINEILQNPLNGGQDWIELYNNSDKVINIKDWQFANFDNDTIANFKTIAGDYLLQPNDYVVLGKDSSFVKQNYPFAVPGKFLFSELPSYNNDSGTVYLIYNAEIIDKVSYLDEWHFDLLDNTDGVSLERIDPNGLSDSEFNWHSAAEDYGFGTPGRKNSQFLPAVSNGNLTLTNEVFSPDNDGFEDILQISYTLSEPGMLAKAQMFDERGRLVKTIFSNEYLGTEGVFYWDGTTENQAKASIGIYILRFEVFSTSGGVFFVAKKAVTLAGKL